jgi:hypothetical protein
MDLLVLIDLEYLVLGIAVTVWVAETLARSGRVLLVDARPSQAALARSRVHLVKVGFYLLGLGYVARKIHKTYGPSLGAEHAATTTPARLSLEILAGKVGATLVVLGALLLCHVYALHRMRRGELLAGAPSAVASARPPST